MIRKGIFLLLFLKVFVCFAQSSKAHVEVVYNFKIIKDSMNKSSIQESENVLLYNSNESIYYSKDEREYYQAITNGGGSLSTIKTSMGNIIKYPKNRGQVYRNEGIIYMTLPLGFDNYEFSESIPVWEILPDRKKIKNIDCQLAKTISETGDVFFAWFAPEFVTTEGPFRFKGLSGLILEVYNKNKTIEISAIEIKKSSEEIKKIPYFRLVKIENKSKFLKARKDFMENPYIYMGEMQVLDSNGNNITRKKMERFTKENVFLN
ncbi:GLPGLI family protein [Chryseobacterium sp. GP-SGM7]|uniref:GLPGLI family protein n=1 Tax=Chryseobacterium sp. GP-SGM7 TaxID=3411323 RepID=UPI003B928BBE